MSDSPFVPSNADRLALVEQNQIEIVRQLATVIKDLAELNKIMRSWSANYPPLNRITKTLQLRAQRLQNMQSTPQLVVVGEDSAPE